MFGKEKQLGLSKISILDNSRLSPIVKISPLKLILTVQFPKWPPRIRSNQIRFYQSNQKETTQSQTVQQKRIFATQLNRNEPKHIGEITSAGQPNKKQPINDK